MHSLRSAPVTRPGHSHKSVSQNAALQEGSTLHKRGESSEWKMARLASALASLAVPTELPMQR